MPDIEQKYLDWIFGPDTGTSAKTIWAVMTGQPGATGVFHADIPYDSGDFGRCHRLLKRFPEWRPRLQEVADAHPRWKPLVDHWDELAKMYDNAAADDEFAAMYRRMQELIGE